MNMSKRERKREGKGICFDKKKKDQKEIFFVFQKGRGIDMKIKYFLCIFNKIILLKSLKVIFFVKVFWKSFSKV